MENLGRCSHIKRSSGSCHKMILSMET
uniref:Uncharacterized protein n=1 Tax=Arundo donax TaxID=35708 RepID=A0A0A9B7R2_ARUDO